MATYSRSLSAGAFNQRVTIEQRSASVDALGQGVETWSTVALVWAQAEPLAGREFLAAGQMQTQANVRFRIRYRTDVTAAMRVMWRGVPHALTAEPIDIDGAQQTLELMCASGLREGAA